MPALLFVLAELLTALRVLRLLRIMRVWPGFRGAMYALRDGATTRPPTHPLPSLLIVLLQPAPTND